MNKNSFIKWQGKFYVTADTERKLDIISLMYPEKLAFDGFTLRTTRINEVIRIIYGMGEGFSENKNRTNGNKSNLSCNVGLLGFEPRKTESKSVVLPLHHNPIGYPTAFQNWECKNKVSTLFSQMDFWVIT